MFNNFFDENEEKEFTKVTFGFFQSISEYFLNIPPVCFKDLAQLTLLWISNSQIINCYQSQ